MNGIKTLDPRKHLPYSPLYGTPQPNDHYTKVTGITVCPRYTVPIPNVCKEKESQIKSVIRGDYHHSLYHRGKVIDKETPHVYSTTGGNKGTSDITTLIRHENLQTTNVEIRAGKRHIHTQGKVIDKETPHVYSTTGGNKGTSDITTLIRHENLKQTNVEIPTRKRHIHTKEHMMMMMCDNQSDVPPSRTSIKTFYDTPTHTSTHTKIYVDGKRVVAL
eukprot:GHVR01062628.1.p1 GENE.GHVR01062628.1~~GHVR01062628.1.p1  ORF type:complete len:218 (+),score=60.05 GHVR01062628.1:21-674(+)